MKKKLILFLVFVFCFALVSSVSDEAINASKSLDEARNYLIEMQEKNISAESVKELLSDAKAIYESELLLENRLGRKGDYSQVFKKTERVEEIAEQAFIVKDELEVFLIFYEDFSENINVSSMDEDYRKIIRSFEEERFSETLDLIEEGYQKLYDLEASQTALKTFYDSTSQSIEKFLKDNWKVISILLVSLVVLYLVFKRAINSFFIRRKIESLKFRKESILNLIKTTQKSYFEKGKMSAEQYKIKVKKFEEMIRDIDRQLPVLRARVRM